MNPGKETAGKVTLKHVYEIAKIKGQDPTLETKSLEEMCFMICGVAKSCGIEVVKELNVDDYRQFLEERKLIVEEQKKELQQIKEAKLLRTGWILCTN